MKREVVEKGIQIKSYEIDAMGIVSNITYIKWFEDIRHDFLDVYYPYNEMMKTGISPMLMKTEVEYKLPLTIQDHPIGKCWVIEMGKMRWEICFEIFKNDKVCCSGIQKGCFWDLNRKRPTYVPKRMRQAFEEYKSE